MRSPTSPRRRPRKPEPAARRGRAKTGKAPKAAAPAEPAAPKYTEGVKAATESFLRGLLERMGVKAEITIRDRDNGGLLVELSGPGMGAVIGRRGETLDAIQHLTNYAVNRGSDKRCHISVDAESYRAKREESLVHLAEKMAAKVVKYKRSMALEPMNSYERHVIHTALQNFEGVSTSSTGTEPNRRVVVSYERPQAASRTTARRAASGAEGGIPVFETVRKVLAEQLEVDPASSRRRPTSSTTSAPTASTSSSWS